MSERMIQLHVIREASGVYEHLLLHRAADEPVYPNVWQVITGGVEEGETFVQGALRELTEETGLVARRCWVVPYTASFFSLKRDKILAVPVFLVLVDTSAEVILSNEHQAYDWVSYESAIGRLVFPSHKEGCQYVHKYILSEMDTMPFPEIPLQ